MSPGARTRTTEPASRNDLGPRRRVAEVVDVCALALVPAGYVVAAINGFSWEYGPLRLSASTPSRMVLIAAGLILFRRWRWPRAPLHPWIARPGRWIRDRFDGGEQAAAADAPLAPATAREWTAVGALFLGLTGLMLAPQVMAPRSVPDLGDPLFSIWRLSWVAHQLPRDPLHLFDGNMFYPELRTLAYSDAMLATALIAAPFLWLGVPQVLVYNAILVLSFAASGVATYALVRRLTGDRPAAAVAGIAFAFYPFRFEHYSHLELLTTFWMPLALLWLHRAMETRRTRDVVVTGLFVAMQALSSLYFGLFLVVALAVVWAVMAFGARLVPRGGDGRVDWLGVVRLWLPAVVVVAVLVLPVTVPYLQNRAQTGERDPTATRLYSATPRSYLLAPWRSLVYGRWLDGPRQPELCLFPGLVIVALAAVGAWPKLDARRGAYLIVAIVALEGSFGSNGLVFPMLRDYVLPFRGLRVPARFTIVFGLALSVLAGYGVSRWRRAARVRPSRAALVPIACAAALLADDLARLDLVPLPLAPPAIYEYFRGAPPAVLADIPFPADPVAATRDARYLYFSTFHWQRLLTGSSGYFPVSFDEATAAMKGFPTERGIRFLQRQRVEFIAIDKGMCEKGGYETMTALLEADPRVELVKRLQSPGREGSVYRVKTADQPTPAQLHHSTR